jgi:hypothetical protein
MSFRLTLREADVLFSKDAFHQRRVDVNALLAPGAIRFAAFTRAHVGLARFVDGGFTWADLLAIGLSGDTLGRTPGVPLLSPNGGLPCMCGVWDELTTWTMQDLGLARMTLADLVFLGVTVASLRNRGLTADGVGAMRHSLTMADWFRFGLDKEDIRSLRLNKHGFHAIGWGYSELQRIWSLTADDMMDIGFRLLS